ncbi:imelysin family protein [Jeongeupia naejangsanensis]|uniref:Imelysin family protein n=1 Tax=Jeongeupia naejangsanensis TaxID=613195 RepID=A0ABS2BMU6_9NEIS|nr:imelysin family protein [Jeongeupia naejangsanensis]MBM3116755.1 imelysin family protein [Jeongeupia naejangsanensis]
MKLPLCALLVLLSAPAFATSQPAGEPAPLQIPVLVRSLADQVYLPGLQALQAESARLQRSVDALCTRPDAEALATAQSAWRNTSLAWRRVESDRVGPLRQDEFINRIDPWPLDAKVLAASLAATPAQPAEPYSFEQWTRQPKGGSGLPAIEAQLFGQAPAQQLAQLKSGRSCGFTQWQAASLARQSQILVMEWQGLRRGLDYDPTYPRPLMTEMLTRSVAGLRELAGWKLAKDEVAPPASRFPDALAGQSRASLLASFDSIRAVLLGAPGGMGFDDYLQSRNRDEVVSTLNGRLDDARRALEALPDDFTSRAGEVRGERVLAQRRLNALADYVDGPMRDALGLLISR